MLSSAAAGIVFVEVVGEGVPTAADAYHHVGSEDLEKENRVIELDNAYNTRATSWLLLAVEQLELNKNLFHKWVELVTL